MTPISAFVITLNEADRLGQTLAAIAQVAAEIIVVDSGSTDGTQDVARNHGARVIEQKFLGYGPQKRFGEEQCTHEWVLNLDADEVMSDALIAEIKALNFNADGYTLKIADVLPGEAFPGRFAHTTKAVRLYKLSKGRYAQSTVHDRVHFSDGAIIKPLHARVNHYSVRSLAHAIDKANRYSSMQAEAWKGEITPWFYVRLVTEPFTAFIKSYLLRLDILRGWAGFSNSMVYSLFRFIRLAKILAHIKSR